MSENSDIAGLLFPSESLALLGAGQQGACAIRELGIETPDFDEQFDAMEKNLETSTHPDAAFALEASRRIAKFSKKSCGWISVRRVDDRIPPAIVMIDNDAYLIARLLGEYTEWVSGSSSDVVRLIELMSEAEESSGRAPKVVMTLFSGASAIAGALIRNGSVDVASTQADRLNRLSLSASKGIESLLEGFSAELT